MNIYINTTKTILVLLILLVSCTEKMDIDLNDSNPQIVVQGNVDDNGKTVITLNKSIGFDESNNFPVVENATVIISDSKGNSETLTESEKGNYTSNNIDGIIGETYHLEIKSGDNLLTSSSKIPTKIPFKFLQITKGGIFGPGHGGDDTEENINIIVIYDDPEDEKNYYRFLEYVNGELKNTYVYDDKLNNGSTINKILFNRDRDLSNGDTLIIEMQCINETTYEYFQSFGNTRGPSSSTPANAVTNITGSKLGYFSAHTTEVKLVLIP